MKNVRIGAGQGFYGDTPRGALDVLRHGEVAYICCDALSELTMAILQRDRMRDPALGYARDLPLFARELLPEARRRRVRIITNAGGLNPAAAAAAVASVARDLGMPDLRIASVTGDDVLSRLPALDDAMLPFEDDPPFSALPAPLIFAAAYIGAAPIVEALAGGAEVVVTGRVADASLFVAPLVAELGWGWTDWDLLAAGVIAGHLLECSAQSTGGNFSGDWWNVPDLAHIGYPVAEVSPYGGIVITKPAGTGGRVSAETVSEQLLYEVGDPASYVNPDVIADVSSVRLADTGTDRVTVSGVRGRRRPDHLKVVGGYLDGFAGTVELVYSWPDAAAKARTAASLIDTLLGDAGLHPSERLVELLGVNALHGDAAPEPADPNEVVLRYSARFPDERSATRLARLVTPLALNGPPHIGGGAPPAPGRPLITPWSALVARAAVESGISVDIRSASEL